jgi:1-acyl-sn-glycerol-3-phosphate acyltransferase
VIIANHSSMADIMLMLAVVKNPFVFVGKNSLKYLYLVFS